MDATAAATDISTATQVTTPISSVSAGDGELTPYQFRSLLFDRLKAWAEADIPARFKTFSFDTSPLRETSPGQIEQLRCESEPKWWLLWGEYGVGKTGLAVSMARNYVFGNGEPEWQPWSVLFRTLPGMLAEIRATYEDAGTTPRNRNHAMEHGDDGWGRELLLQHRRGFTRAEGMPTAEEIADLEARLADYRRPKPRTEEALLELYSEVDVLVLDDAGAEASPSSWALDRMYQVLAGRHAEEKPTIVTSNLSPAQLAKHVGERITWRVVEACGPEHVVHVKGPNLRASA